MNIVNKLTLRHIRENKGRTVITTMGIIVSVAMITAVFVSLASFMNFFGTISRLMQGDAVAWGYSLTDEQFEKLSKDERVGAVGRFSLDSEMILEENRDEEKEPRQICSMLAGDDVYLKQKITGEYEGVLPTDDTEIALEQKVLDGYFKGAKIGDRIELCIIKVPSQGGTQPENASAPEIDTKSYTLTAILKDNPSSRGSVKAFRGISDKDEAKDGAILLKEVNRRSRTVLEDMMKEYGIEDYELHDDYLDSKMAFAPESSILVAFLPMTIFLLAVILVASVLLIYNAFGMSLSERVRYLGMLASVGATRKQKKGSVYFEGFILGVIGIPLGILAGIAGIAVTLRIVGDRIVSTGMIAGLSGSNMHFTTVVPLWSILAIVLYSAFTIWISSWLPAAKASRITPIDAIRQTKEIRIRKKKLSTPRYIRWIFGYEGELAHKNLKRNGRKARVITFSIMISVVLFLTVNYFCDLFVQANQLSAEMPYQVYLTIYEEEDRESMIKEVRALPDVDKAFRMSQYFLKNDTDDENSKLNDDFINREYLTKTYNKVFDKKVFLYIIGIEEEEFDRLCKENGITPSEYKEDKGDLPGALLNNLSRKEGGAAVFNDKIIGQPVNLKVGDCSIRVDGLASYKKDDYICNLTPPNSLTLFVPADALSRRLGNEEEGGTIFSYGIVTDKHEEVRKAIDKIQTDGNYHAGCMDMIEDMNAMNTIVFVLQVFVYGFITLITLITIANIINTVSTGIALRRKEFAMLRSVGTTPGGMRKMVCLESLLYALRALVVGIPLSILFSYFLNRQLASDVIPFEVNLPLYLIVIACVLVLIGTTMLYAVSRLRKLSIVETLKEEAV